MLQIGLTIFAYIIVIAGAIAEGFGFDFSNQSWINGEINFSKMSITFGCFFCSTVIYILSVKFQKSAGINNSFLQNLLFFSATVVVLIFVNFLNGRFSKWTVDMWIAAILATVAIGYLVVKTNA